MSSRAREQDLTIGDQMTHAMQKNILGMLSDLNRAKTIRMQGQANTRDIGPSSFKAKKDFATTSKIDKSKLTFFGQSTQNRPNLMIQTSGLPSMPSASMRTQTNKSSSVAQKRAPV